MRISEIITNPSYLEELTFMGSPCTKDCSGHAAGYKWGLDHGGATTLTPSRSFDNGTYIAAAQRKRRAQGGGKLPGYVSQTPGARRKRAQRIAARKSAAAQVAKGPLTPS